MGVCVTLVERLEALSTILSTRIPQHFPRQIFSIAAFSSLMRQQQGQKMPFKQQKKRRPLTMEHLTISQLLGQSQSCSPSMMQLQKQMKFWHFSLQLNQIKSTYPNDKKMNQLIFMLAVGLAFRTLVRPWKQNRVTEIKISID